MHGSGDELVGVPPAPLTRPSRRLRASHVQVRIFFLAATALRDRQSRAERSMGKKCTACRQACCTVRYSKIQYGQIHQAFTVERIRQMQKTAMMAATTVLNSTEILHELPGPTALSGQLKHSTLWWIPPGHNLVTSASYRPNPATPINHSSHASGEPVIHLDLCTTTVTNGLCSSCCDEGSSSSQSTPPSVSRTHYTVLYCPATHLASAALLTAR